MPYHERLQSLGALSLNNLRLYSGMFTVYKSLHSGSAKYYGLFLVSSNTRANGVKLVQRRANTRTTSSLFNCRTPIEHGTICL